MVKLSKALTRVRNWRASWITRFSALPRSRQNTIIWTVAVALVVTVSIFNPDPAYAQNLESFASKVRGLLSSTLLRTLAVIAVIVTGLLWFTGRASPSSGIGYRNAGAPRRPQTDNAPVETSATSG